VSSKTAGDPKKWFLDAGPNIYASPEPGSASLEKIALGAACIFAAY